MRDRLVKMAEEEVIEIDLAELKKMKVCTPVASQLSTCFATL